MPSNPEVKVGDWVRLKLGRYVGKVVQVEEVFDRYIECHIDGVLWTIFFKDLEPALPPAPEVLARAQSAAEKSDGEVKAANAVLDEASDKRLIMLKQFLNVYELSLTASKAKVEAMSAAIDATLELIADRRDELLRLRKGAE